MKYTEIFKLKTMLEKKGIPFEYRNESDMFKQFGDEFEKHHICYPVFNLNKRVCSVIQGDGTYGGEQDLLEIMKDDCVIGYLTAKEVFNKIKKHYKERSGE